MSCLRDLLKHTTRLILFILNLLLVLFSLGVIALSIVYIYIDHRDSDHTEDALPIDKKFFHFGCGFALALALFLLLICIPLGFYYGIYKQRPLCLIMYSALLLLAGMVSFVVGALVLAIRTEDRKDSMRIYFKSYEEHEKYIETLQKEYHCCGGEKCSLNNKTQKDCILAIDEAYQHYQSNLGAVIIISALLAIACGVLGIIIWKLMRKAPSGASG